MKEIIIHIIDLVVPAILAYIAWCMKEDRKERKANTQGMKEILGYMIDRWHEEFILQGYVTTDQRNTFDSVFKAYAANKGNGARLKKHEEVTKLPVDDTKSGMSPYLKFYLEQKEKNDKD